MAKNIERHKKRIHWVDILKFLAIFAVYLGHNGESAGKSHAFVYLYSIPLFFFVSGFFTRSTQVPLLKYCKDKFQRLMVPYFTFSLLALAYFSFFNRWEISQIFLVGKSFLFGIRGQVFALSLWFIPCLFVITVAHFTILKVVKSGYVTLGISVLLFIVSQTILPYNPLEKPVWIMNLDSAMYYYVFYVLGSLSFPFFNKLFFSLSTSQKIIRVTIGIFSISIAIICFTTGDGWFTSQLIHIFPLLHRHSSLIHYFLLLPIGLILIYLNIIVAKLISKIHILEKIGQETIILCGTEDIFKDFLRRFFGWAIHLVNPVVTILFSLLCLIISFYTIVPFLNRHIPKLVGRVGEKT